MRDSDRVVRDSHCPSIIACLRRIRARSNVQNGTNKLVTGRVFTLKYTYIRSVSEDAHLQIRHSLALRDSRIRL